MEFVSRHMVVENATSESRKASYHVSKIDTLSGLFLYHSQMKVNS